MALYTIDRINRLRAYLGVSPETPWIGGHAECDKIDAILGINTTGGIRWRHWGDTCVNPVGLRVAKLEVRCFGLKSQPRHDFRDEGWFCSDPICQHCKVSPSFNPQSAEAPCGSPVTSYFWLGAEGGYL